MVVLYSRECFVPEDISPSVQYSGKRTRIRLKHFFFSFCRRPWGYFTLRKRRTISLVIGRYRRASLIFPVSVFRPTKLNRNKLTKLIEFSSQSKFNVIVNVLFVQNKNVYLNVFTLYVVSSSLITFFSKFYLFVFFIKHVLHLTKISSSIAYFS